MIGILVRLTLYCYEMGNKVAFNSTCYCDCLKYIHINNNRAVCFGTMSGPVNEIHRIIDVVALSVGHSF